MFNGPNGAGKGDKRRNMKISTKEFEERWNKIFGHKGLDKNIFKEKNGKKKKKSNKKNN
tara:strand:- start:503 stop:679 length:177 start_codon:yes stop_codon:yes gene_type:complete